MIKRFLTIASLLLAASLNASAQMQWVDLGLSVKWASCNLGANSPEQHGDYYAWGEIETKEKYTDENSKWYGVSNDDLRRLGVIDANGNLTALYDVAQELGKGRMPTLAEIQELEEKCTWRWTTMNNEKGMRVIGSNGNSIFIPAAGGIEDLSGFHVGSFAWYWVSTVNIDSDRAYGYDFDYRGSFWRNFSRYFGFPIRPVMDK